MLLPCFESCQALVSSAAEKYRCVLACTWASRSDSSSWFAHLRAFSQVQLPLYLCFFGNWLHALQKPAWNRQREPNLQNCAYLPEPSSAWLVLKTQSLARTSLGTLHRVAALSQSFWTHGPTLWSLQIALQRFYVSFRAFLCVEQVYPQRVFAWPLPQSCSSHQRHASTFPRFSSGAFPHASFAQSSRLWSFRSAWCTDLLGQVHCLCYVNPGQGYDTLRGLRLGTADLLLQHLCCQHGNVVQ